MGVLPPIDPASIGRHHSVVLPRDHWVRLDTCDYSVRPSAIGHRVDVHADPNPIGQEVITIQRVPGLSSVYRNRQR